MYKNGIAISIIFPIPIHIFHIEFSCYIYSIPIRYLICDTLYKVKLFCHNNCTITVSCSQS